MEAAVEILEQAQNTVYLCREPILDPDKALFGYQIRSWDPVEGSLDANIETARTLTHTLIDIGIDHMVGSAMALIDMPTDFLTGSLTLPLDPERVVIGVMNSVAPTPDVLAGVRDLRAAGMQIALSMVDGGLDSTPLLDLAQIVKIDPRGRVASDLAGQVALLRQRGVETLIADQVSTPEQFATCKDAGFDYFQGFFFAEPDLIAGQQLPSSQLSLLQLMSKAWQPDVELDDLEVLIRADVALTYKLLKFINSAAFSLRSEINSIKSALVTLGLRNLARWISLLAIATMEDGNRELATVALVRARLCELRAEREGKKKEAPIYFTGGLLSILDALLGKEMKEVIEYLPLSEELNAALVDRRGPLGAAIARAVAHERGECGRETDAVAGGEAAEDYLAALSWARETLEAC